MDAISYTTARNNLATTMEKVCNDHSPIIITRQNADPVIMMSLADYNSIQETAYLLRSPKNAAILAQSIQELKEGNIVQRNKLEE
jgi:antitoxin YefM